MTPERRVVVLQSSGLYFLVCCQIAIVNGDNMHWEDISTPVLHENAIGRAITDYMVTGDWNYTANQYKRRP